MALEIESLLYVCSAVQTNDTVCQVLDVLNNLLIGKKLTFTSSIYWTEVVSETCIFNNRTDSRELAVEVTAEPHKAFLSRVNCVPDWSEVCVML